MRLGSTTESAKLRAVSKSSCVHGCDGSSLLVAIGLPFFLVFFVIVSLQTMVLKMFWSLLGHVFTSHLRLLFAGGRC